jgi:AcrR family transcriptional regulator
MPRIVNEQAHAEKRKQILDVALQLIYTRGYEQMSIQDILAALAISKGAFYHYFDSKPALLDALVERMIEDALVHVQPTVADPALSATEKLRCLFQDSNRWKAEHKNLMLELARIWYDDHNALVRRKWLLMQRVHILPILRAVFAEGMQTGEFQIELPDQLSEVFFWMLQGFGESLAELMLAQPQPVHAQQQAQAIAAAYNIAIERLLGAATGSVQMIEAAALREWFDAVAVSG